MRVCSQTVSDLVGKRNISAQILENNVTTVKSRDKHQVYEEYQEEAPKLACG